ncbi:hypothetical protein TNCT_699711 [Trichonephila clavata]|uniref:Uncharacterized protein n=1 Tax=Trichonephila clavata TaxID=2740835 RepID=A0A8X6JHX5_TRICU|nr:hypothetical protein TNCT_699711 [Trichonephila clavata]
MEGTNKKERGNRNVKSPASVAQRGLKLKSVGGEFFSLLIVFPLSYCGSDYIYDLWLLRIITRRTSLARNRVTNFRILISVSFPALAIPVFVFPILFKKLRASRSRRNESPLTV